jgi:integration host factor subunit beta
MTKSELINLLAERFPQLVVKDAELSVKAILDAMTDNLSTGERIEIRGFGSFSLNYRVVKCKCLQSMCRTLRPVKSCVTV